MNNEERYAEQAPDDVEGHKIYATSDRNVKDNVEPVAWDEKAADDVEGHSHRNLDPRAGEDDVAGHQMSGEIRPDIYGDAGRTP